MQALISGIPCACSIKARRQYPEHQPLHHQGEGSNSHSADASFKLIANPLGEILANEVRETSWFAVPVQHAACAVAICLLRTHAN